MKKSFMTRVLAVSLSAAMAFSLPSANLMTASAAATVSIAKTATVKVGNTKTLKLKKNNSDWKITKVATNKKKVCTAKKKSNKAFTITGVKKGTATISVTIRSPKRKAANKAKSKWQKVLKTKVTVNPKSTTPTTPTTPSTATDPTTPTTATDPTGATTPTDPTGAVTPTGELGITTVKSLARTTVEVVFNQPVDAVTKDNFKITEKESGTAVAVEDAILSENKLTATLTLANNARLGIDYKIEISGLACGGAAQGTLEGEYTSLTTNDEFVAVMESDDTYLQADNNSNTQVRFKIYDGTGKLRTDVNNVEVRFTTTRGSVGGQSVVVRGGVAEVQFTSQNVTSDVTAVITGEVISAAGYGDLLGLKSTTSILLTLNAGDIDASQGAMLTSINALTADRIIAYFNKPVKPEDFLAADGKIDPDKAEVVVTDQVGLTNRNDFSPVTILPFVDGNNVENDQAFEILLDKPLTDNSEISLKFKDKRYNVQPENTAYDRLVDATQPAVYNVDVKSLRKIDVIFSEAVLTNDVIAKAGNSSDRVYSAENIDNYRINGQKLSDISTNAKVEVSTDADKRNIATITLGTEDGKDDGKPVYLKPNRLYSVQVSNIGDWAALTDKAKNVVHTQTFYFDVAENNTAPKGEATVQSPEQFLVKFNGEVAAVGGADKNKTLDKIADENLVNIIQLQEYDSRDGWKDVTYNNENPIRVRKLSATNEYIVELTRDWTVIYNTASTRDNYYNNHRYQLHIDKDTVYNYDNGIVNSSEINISLTDTTTAGSEKLLNADNTSPEIVDVIQLGDKYMVQLNEPVQVPMPNYPKRHSTPSQDQGNEIQQPTARFINTATKETVDATVDEYLYEDDTWVRISPNKVLSSGEWELTITALTDDVGNTIKSSSYKFPVTGTNSASDLHVVWAAASNVEDYNVFRSGELLNGNGSNVYPTNRNARYVFIKFSEPMSNKALSTSALVQSNYTINGVEVPRTANIVGYIKGYSANNVDAFDSVTIDLGENNDFNLSESRQVAVTIASSLTAESGKVLGNTGRITLPWKYGTNDSNYTNQTSRYSQVDASNDDIWGNHSSELAGAGLAALQDALENEKYRTVIVPSKITVPEKTTINITRPVELDLDGQTIDLTNANSGITISYSDTGIVKINTSKDNGKITCRPGKVVDDKQTYETAVTIDTPNTDLWIGGQEIDCVDADGKIIRKPDLTGKVVEINDLIIRDIKTNTFTNFNGKINSLVVTDAGGTGIVNLGKSEISRLELDGSAKYYLTNEATMDKVVVTRANTVEVKATNDSKAITSIESARNTTNLIINTIGSHTIFDYVANAKGFNSVTNSSGDKIENANKYSAILDKEMNKFAPTSVTVSGSSVTFDVKNAITSGAEPIAATGTADNADDCTLTYTAAIVDSVAGVSVEGTTVTFVNGNNLSNGTRVTVKITGKLVKGEGTDKVEIAVDKTIVLTVQK